MKLTDARSRWAVVIDENLPPRELWPQLVFRLPELQYPDTLNLADHFRLTVYDAAYLELARRRTLPLATLDQELRTAATAIGVTVLGADLT